MSGAAHKVAAHSLRSKFGIGLVSFSVVAVAAIYLVGPAVPAAYSATLTVKPVAGVAGKTVVYGSFSSQGLPVTSAVVTIRTAAPAAHGKTPSHALPLQQVIRVAGAHSYRAVIGPGNETISVVITSGGHVMKASKSFVGRTGRAYKVSGRVNKTPRAFVFIPFTSY